MLIGDAASSRGPLVEVLQELVGCKLDLLVPPLGCAVVAGDKSHAVQPAEVAVNERVAGLCLIWSAFGKAEMPGGVLVPRVRLQVHVLVTCARLHVLPA